MSMVTHINLPVQNLNNSFKFYEDLLGAKFITSFKNKEGEDFKYVLEVDGFDLFLEKTDGVQIPKVFHFGVKLEREELFKKFESLKESHEHLKDKLIDNPVGSDTYRFYIKDPDNTIIEFYDAI